MENFVSGLVCPGWVDFPEGLKRDVDQISTALTEAFLQHKTDETADWAKPFLADVLNLMRAMEAWLCSLPEPEKPKFPNEMEMWNRRMKGILSQSDLNRFFCAMVDKGIALGTWEMLAEYRQAPCPWPADMESRLALQLARVMAGLLVSTQMESNQVQMEKVKWSALVDHMAKSAVAMRSLTLEMTRLVFPTQNEPRFLVYWLGEPQLQRSLPWRARQSHWALTLNRVWLSMVQATMDAQGLQAGLAVLFDRIDNAMLDGQVMEVQQLLGAIEVSQVSLELLMGVLTVTVDWRKELPMREFLFDRTWEMAVESMGEVRARKVLEGLVA